jgi:hypothetical protein
VFGTEERDIYMTEYVCVVFGGLGIPCLNDLVASERIACASVLCCAELWASCAKLRI